MIAGDVTEWKGHAGLAAGPADDGEREGTFHFYGAPIIIQSLPVAIARDYQKQDTACANSSVRRGPGPC